MTTHQRVSIDACPLHRMIARQLCYHCAPKTKGICRLHVKLDAPEDPYFHKQVEFSRGKKKSRVGHNFLQNEYFFFLSSNGSRKYAPLQNAPICVAVRAVLLPKRPYITITHFQLFNRGKERP